MKKLSLFIIIVFVLFIFSIPFIIDYFNKINLENNFESKLELREELIEEIKRGTITINENGLANLTEKYHDVAENNYVEVYECNNQETVISFLYNAGFPDESQYIVYSSHDEKLIENNINKSLYKYIEKIKNNWYFVQFN